MQTKKVITAEQALRMIQLLEATMRHVQELVAMLLEVAKEPSGTKARQPKAKADR